MGSDEMDIEAMKERVHEEMTQAMDTGQSPHRGRPSHLLRLSTHFTCSPVLTGRAASGVKANPLLKKLYAGRR